MAFSSSDREFMSRALSLAARGRFTTTPNPNVGCVIVNNDQIVGEGWHRAAGQHHAEVYALQQVGNAAQGAICYVTLEPCSHHGRTGPCADALIEAGVARVVVATQDPNPEVAGAGIQKLRDAGIVVDEPLFEEQARQLNRGFFKRHEQGYPWVTVKMAASVDGRTAMASGESKWITSPAARRDVQFLRAGSCAIITGFGTVELDDPAMTVRLTAQELDIADEVRQPLRVVIDSRLRISTQAQVLRGPGSVLIATLQDLSSEKARQLQAHGADLVQLPERNGKLNLDALLAELANRGCNQVLVEAGSQLAGAFVAEGLLDELVVYMAPKLLGSTAQPLLDLPIQTMDAHLALSLRDTRMIGEDIKMTYYPDKEY